MLREDLPATLSTALKEWAVAVRALREGRQVILLRKGGIREADGQFAVEARAALLFPTYLHEDEQAEAALQPCYQAWLREETARRPPGEAVRIEAAAQITDVFVVTNFDALLRLHNQHIYSETFVRYRIENEPQKPLYCLFLRAYDLPSPVTIPLEMDHYGCRSWIPLNATISTAGALPAMSDAAYAERVRITRNLLTRS